jgi:glycosyltransferase involved in cell wall biosynthesis
MRVIYHHRTRGEHVEGVHIRGLISGMRMLGLQVILLSPRGVESESIDSGAAESRSDRGFVWAAIRRLAKSSPEILFEFAEIFYNLLAFVRLRLLIRSRRPAFIYERYALFMFAGVLLAKSRGIPIVLEMNDSAIVERVRPLVLRSLATRMEGWILRKATGLVFVSTQFEKDCRGVHGALPPSVVSPNCADAHLFDPSRFDKAAVRAKLRIGPEMMVAGYVGHFVPWHGVQWFVDEIVGRMKESPRLLLLLVGDGGVYEDVRRKVHESGQADRILLPGRVPHSQVPEMMAAMDFAVLPDSNVFGSPMKLFEFMAMGVPVVAPALPPIAEVIEHGKTGWLFPPRNARICVDTTLAVARARESLSAAGRKAREQVLRRHQWVHNARAILSLTGLHGAEVRE